MKNILKSPDSIEVRESPRHGYGVYARKNISEGELLEECYYLPLSTSWDDLDEKLKDYVFINNVTAVGVGSSVEISSSAAVFGSAMIYNYSMNPNVEYKKYKSKKAFAFYALKDISEDEELCIDYGKDSYSAKRIMNNSETVTWM